MKVTKEMGIMEAASKYPESIKVFQAFGMHCFGCMAAKYETIGEGAQAHNIDADALVKSINEALNAIDATK